MNCEFDGGRVRKGQVAIWATLTFGLAWGLFAIALPIYNRRKTLNPVGSAPVFLLLPFLVQMLWVAGAGICSARRKRREPIMGVLLGFGLEFIALIVPIVISAFAHY